MTRSIRTRNFSQMAIAALVVAVASCASAPAQAQFGSPFVPFERDRDNPDRLPELMICNTEYRVRQNFANEGYTNIYLGGRASESGKVIEVKATLDGVTYLMNYNRCTQQVMTRKALRR